MGGGHQNQCTNIWWTAEVVSQRCSLHCVSASLPPPSLVALDGPFLDPSSPPPTDATRLPQKACCRGEGTYWYNKHGHATSRASPPEATTT